MDTILYEERSQTSSSGKRTVLFFVAALLVWMGYTTYKSISHGAPFIDEYAVELISLYVLIKQAASKFQYVLTEEAFIIKEKGIFRNSELVIPYEDIDGVCPYTREVFGRIKFRYKYRKSSSLDQRKVWELVFSLTGKKRVKHARVLIKAEDELFTVLEEKIPGKVKVTLDDVAFTALLREEAHKRGYKLGDYMEVFEAERNAESGAEK